MPNKIEDMLKSLDDLENNFFQAMEDDNEMEIEQAKRDLNQLIEKVKKMQKEDDINFDFDFSF